MLMYDRRRLWAGWAGVTLMFTAASFVEIEGLGTLMAAASFLAFLTLLIQWNVVRSGWDFLAFLGCWFLANLCGVALAVIVLFILEYLVQLLIGA